MGFDIDGDGLAISEADIGHMRLPVYRIHDTTNHLLTNYINICLQIYLQIYL